jgi:MFS family permease
VRGKAISSIFVGFNLGPMIGGILGMALLSRYSWRSLFLVEFLALILFPIVWLYLPESVRFLTQKGKNEEAIRALRRLEKAAGVAPVDWTPESLAVPVSAQVGIGKIFKSNLGVMTLLIWAVCFLALLAFFGVQTWLPQMLMKAGHSMVRSYSFSVVFPIGGIVGMFLIGGIMDRVGRKWALIPAFVCGGIAIWLFGVFTSDAGIYVMGALIGFFVGGCSVTGINVVMGETYPTQFRSSGIGWAGTIGRFGSMFGPLLGGAMQMARFSFGQFFIVFAIPLFLAAVLVAFFRVNVRRESLETVTEKLTARR